MTDDDITAFRAAPPPVPAARRRRRVWPWLVLALALLMLLLTAGALAALLDIVGAYNGSPLSVTIDGDTWRLDTLQGLHGTAGVGVLVGVLGALLLAVLLVVPVVVLTVLLAAGLAVGLALLAAVVVAGIALSPLLLLGALLWWAVRPRRTPPALAPAR
jgi:hypothetical protein